MMSPRILIAGKVARLFSLADGSSAPCATEYGLPTYDSFKCDASPCGSYA